MRNIDRSRKPVGQAMKLMDQHPAPKPHSPPNIPNLRLLARGKRGRGDTLLHFPMAERLTQFAP